MLAYIEFSRNKHGLLTGARVGRVDRVIESTRGRALPYPIVVIQHRGICIGFAFDAEESRSPHFVLRRRMALSLPSPRKGGREGEACEFRQQAKKNRRM